MARPQDDVCLVLLLLALPTLNRLNSFERVSFQSCLLPCFFRSVHSELHAKVFNLFCVSLASLTRPLGVVAASGSLGLTLCAPLLYCFAYWVTHRDCCVRMTLRGSSRAPDLVFSATIKAVTPKHHSNYHNTTTHAAAKNAPSKSVVPQEPTALPRLPPKYHYQIHPNITLSSPSKQR